MKYSHTYQELIFASILIILSDLEILVTATTEKDVLAICQFKPNQPVPFPVNGKQAIHNLLGQSYNARNLRIISGI